jgi:hypothetical protein
MMHLYASAAKLRGGGPNLRFGLEARSLFTKNAGDLKVFWQDPTGGYDLGGDGARTMMLVYSKRQRARRRPRYNSVSQNWTVGGTYRAAPTRQRTKCS